MLKRSLILYQELGVFSNNKKLIIKEINTGYDSRFWNYDTNNEKTGVLTAAFFSDERVINIKGLKIFNKLASLIPEVLFYNCWRNKNSN